MSQPIGIPKPDPDPPECVCGHAPEVHEHYRKGSDCSISACSCTKFRPTRRKP